METPLTRALKKSRPRPLDDQENEYGDEGLLSTIGSTALSGIARIGNLLDVPGSMARDLIGGENPFDQLLPWNLTTDENRLSGRDLLRKAGMVGQDDTYGNWWGGLAAEIALDPLTYATFGAGALTKGGKVLQAIDKVGDVAKVAGKGDRVAKLTTKVGDVINAGGRATREAAEGAAKRMGVNLADVANETVGSLARLEIPFTDIGINIGTASTPGALKVAEGLDYAGEFVKASPLGRLTRGLFDPAVGGEFTKAGQESMEFKYAKVAAANEAVRTQVAEHIAPLKEIEREFANHFGPVIRSSKLAEQATPQLADNLMERSANSLVRLTAELGGDLPEAMNRMSLPLGKMPMDLQRKIIDLGKNMQAEQRASHNELVSMGAREATLQSITADEAGAPFEHFARFGTDRGGGIRGWIKHFSLRTGSSMGRNDVIRYVPADVVDRLLVDEAARGEKAVEHILKTYGKHLGRESVEETDELGKVVSKKAVTKEKHAAQLAGWVREHEAFPIFNNSVWADHTKYMTDSFTRRAELKAIYELIEKNVGNLVEDNLRTVLPDEVREAVHGWRVGDLLADSRVNLDAPKALKYLNEKMGRGAGDINDLAGRLIPEDIANAIIAMRKTGEPTWMEQIGNIVDEATDLFKRNVTLPFPSFWSRNLLGGQFVNAVSGLFQRPEDFTAYGGRMKEAFNLWKTGDGDFVKELFVNDVVDYRALSEGVRSTSTVPEFGYVGNPANVKQTFGEVASEVAENPLFKSTPLNAAVDPLRKGYGTAMRTGEKASGMVEFMNRVPMYLYLTRDLGWTPSAAAAKVKELQIDYSSLTQWEKQVMRRMAPFYSFSRKIAPVLLGTLAERPGGALAQTIRASREASGSDATTPEWVQNTLSIPNPFKTPEPGGASYITGFGLPFETIAGYAEGPRGAGREALSQLNPILKAPLEYFTNQSFFQSGPGGAGRSLDDLDPTIGRTIANVKERFTGERERNPDYLPRGVEFAIANSPASRFASTARQLTDPRKTLLDTAVNMLTGARVTDISPAAQDAVLRDRAMELMKDLGSRSFSKTYFPDDALESMTPAERGLAEKLEELQGLLAERAKARRQ